MERILGFDNQFVFELIINLINTGILIAILNHYLYTPVKEFLQKRTDTIDSNIKSAKNQLKEAEELKESYENKLKDIEKERIEILENARKKSSEAEIRIVEEAKNEALQMKKRAQVEVSQEKEKAKDEMKTQIIELSTSMAARFVKSSIDEKAQNQLIDEVISDMGDVKWNS